MKQPISDHLIGATLALSVGFLLISAGYLFFYDEFFVEKSEWVKDGVLEKRTIKLPVAESQASRINWDLVQ